MGAYGAGDVTRASIDRMYKRLQECQARLKDLEITHNSDPEKQEIPGLQQTVNDLLQQITLAEARLVVLEAGPAYETIDYQRLLDEERGRRNRATGSYVYRDPDDFDDSVDPDAPQQTPEEIEAERVRVNEEHRRQMEQRVRESRFSWRMWNTTAGLRAAIRREWDYMFPPGS